MKKRGFTLIELLAVIVILAVIALITTPIIIGIIEDSQEQANRRSVDGLVRSGTYYFSQSLFDNTKSEKIRNEENLINEISYEGKGPEEGQLYVNEHSDVALAVKYGNKCYKKEYTGNIISLDYNPVTCKLNINIEKPEITITADNVFNELGWSKENFYVTINTVDHSGLGTKIKWCGTSNETCEPTTLIDGKTGHIQFTQETDGTKVCAKAIDGFSNESNTICSNAYKLDKTSPSFTGIEDITVNVGGSVDLISGVGVSDSLSGIKGTITYNPTSIDTSKTGSYPITYHVEDNAGNTKEITRNVIVNSNNPTISFTATEGSINSNGWAKSNFYVTVNTTDYSGHGIEKVVWCGTTSNTCTPSTEVSGTSQNVLISQESNNNRICAYAIDKGGHIGSTTCSDAYKLDKTAPTAGTLNISGTLGSNNWYTSDVNLVVNAGSDSLSGHATSTSNITSITSNTTGTTVTVTTTDLAGNTSTRDYTIKVDKNAPTLTAKSESVTIVQGTSNAVSSYFNTPTYSISGGNWSCSPTNTSGLTAGNQTVSCTATGGNGLTTTTRITVTVNSLDYKADISAMSSSKFVAAYIQNGNGIIKVYNYSAAQWSGSVIATIPNVSDISVSGVDDTHFFVGYIQNGNGVVQYYQYSAAQWSPGTVTNIANINNISISAANNQKVFIGYTQNGNAIIKNGNYSAVQWSIGTLATISNASNISISANSDTKIFVGYNQSGNGIFKSYKYSSSQWGESTIATISGATNLDVGAVNDNKFYASYNQNGNGIIKDYNYSAAQWGPGSADTMVGAININISGVDDKHFYATFTQNNSGYIKTYNYSAVQWSGSIEATLP